MPTPESIARKAEARRGSLRRLAGDPDKKAKKNKRKGGQLGLAAKMAKKKGKKAPKGKSNAVNRFFSQLFLEN